MLIRLAQPAELPYLQEIEVASGEPFRDVGLPEIADDDPMSLEALAEHEVWRSWDGSWQRIALVSTAILDYYDLGLPDRTYRYFVVAVDKAGNRTSSDVVAAEVGPADLEPPTAPVLSAVNEGGSWYLRWTPSTDDRGIREYSVWRNGSLFQFLPGASITELWLVSGAAGTWKVRATPLCASTRGEECVMSSSCRKIRPAVGLM